MKASTSQSWWIHGAATILSLACGAPGSDATTNGQDSTSTTMSHDASTGAEPWPFAHGYIAFAFSSANPEQAALLDGTDTVVISADYGECLAAYYTANPELQQFGDDGASIFGDASQGGEGWKDLLCSPLIGEHASCDIVWITQRFDAVKSLTVTYEITADLATLPLLFGPLPTAATAQCVGGTQPMVVVTDGMSMRGVAPGGDTLWTAVVDAPLEAVTLAPDPVSVAILPAAP